MTLSLFCLVTIGVAVILYNFDHGQASEMSDLLDEEITRLSDEIVEKRGGPKKRPPCGFTWRCRRRAKSKGRRLWGKKNEISIASFDTFGADDLENVVQDYVINELERLDNKDNDK